MSQTDKFKILTPHAAVIVWNYNDRITGDINGTIDEEGIDFTLISTVSCVSIQTSKSKSSPAGSFQLVLAPFKNWVGTLTAGSWCAILMSNKPITATSIGTADAEQVKMFGKIESVRVDTGAGSDGARQTRFLVSGTDWGHIFNNVLYIDNLLSAAEEGGLGSGAAIAIRKVLLGDENTPESFAVKDNLVSLLNIFGNNLDGYTEAGDDINRLAKSTYDFILPDKVAKFFNFTRPAKGKATSRVITKLINLQTGRLNKDNTYDGAVDSFGYINPFSLQGTNTFWQILLDNSNPALNEMYNEIVWGSDGHPQLTLFNRIKPFSYKLPKNNVEVSNSLRSQFQNIKTHEIDTVSVMSVNAGTNWRDKYNFIEIKPQFQEFAILGNWIKTKSQLSDTTAFNREGFRPMIVGTKQFPVSPEKGKTGKAAFDVNQLGPWTQLLSEWYFDTHRLLNGSMVITGQNEYIAVGNNIRFDAGLINPTPNINKATSQLNANKFILAHVENVSHSFSTKDDGAREYLTTIQFVRGIVVNQNGSLVGEGALDQFTEDMSPEVDRNTLNNITTSEDDDPDSQKVKGT